MKRTTLLELIVQLAEACEEAQKLLEGEFPEPFAGARVSVKTRLSVAGLDSHRVAELLQQALSAAIRNGNG